MLHNRPISDLFAENRTLISVEFFPPKDEAGGERIVNAAKEIRKEVKPDFVSITYGAGGSTRERTFRYAKTLKEDYGFQVMPHLTCVGSSKKELIEIVEEYKNSGFCNIMALRGDPPKGENDFQPHPDGLTYASDLVGLIRSHFSGFSLGVGGYPEVHPEAPHREADLKNLKHKVDQGASFITTQLFYDNEVFKAFIKDCREIGIQVPILPGLMPIKSAKQARRFCKNIPDQLSEALDAAGEDEAEIAQVSEDWLFKQMTDLIQWGVPGIHLYIMNKSDTAVSLMKRISKTGLLG